MIDRQNHRETILKNILCVIAMAKLETIY